MLRRNRRVSFAAEFSRRQDAVGAQKSTGRGVFGFATKLDRYSNGYLREPGRPKVGSKRGGLRQVELV